MKEAEHGSEFFQVQGVMARRTEKAGFFGSDTQEPPKMTLIATLGKLGDYWGIPCFVSFREFGYIW